MLDVLTQPLSPSDGATFLAAIVVVFVILAILQSHRDPPYR